ncbi:MAG: SpoIID/LytB domain-containing protein [Bacteroidaceae bacterium]|nr:SpoIID/LytB domain-containing protein [Bacteroidaceae bacterium]
MRIIDVGILLLPRIEFTLNGRFVCNGVEVSGQGSVAINDGKVEWNGVQCDRLLFVPQEQACSFTLKDVVIGINFHWERREDQTFKGQLLLFVEQGRVRAVNRVDVEEYLVSVISSEMSATSSLQLLKAHAVVSRSWLYAQLCRASKGGSASLCEVCNDRELVRWYAREDHELFDFCADDHCQRYQGITRAANPNVVAAVGATAGLVLVSDGEVCDARFSKCCGGVTENFAACWENEEIPYLTAFRDSDPKSALPDLTSEQGARHWIESVPESFCSAPGADVIAQVLNGYDRETADFYRWQVCYTAEELSRLLKEKSGLDFGVVKELVPLERGASGRIIRLQIVGSEREFTVGKELEIRRWLSPTHLYSSAFVVDKVVAPDGTASFILKGAGWGHGVGLCQIGAAVMGDKGYDYRDILSHYYPDTELKNIGDVMRR